MCFQHNSAYTKRIEDLEATVVLLTKRLASSEVLRTNLSEALAEARTKTFKEAARIARDHGDVSQVVQWDRACVAIAEALDRRAP